MLVKVETSPGRTPSAIEVTSRPDGTHVAVSGELGLRDLSEVEARLSALTGPVTFDLSGARRIDTSIAWAVVDSCQRLERSGARAGVTGAQGAVARLLDTVRQGMPPPATPLAGPRGPRAWLTQLGEAVAGSGAAFVEFTGVLGLFVARLAQTFLRPREFRLTALVHHCQAVGLQAVPIVALLSFLIGVVLAFQGAAQLRQFGAEVFVVELIAISILRELGILLTAIIVAGRTASAFTAAIGSMKMREEIDAMRTLGIDPGHALIVPRVLALVLMLPILGLIANVAGLFGGALMSWTQLGISPAMFMSRLAEGTEVAHVFVGLVKAPVFAVLIGVIGCRAGLAVGSTAESLGRMTSSAVVAAIFAVILADALFSIFFEQIGV
ncbi:phospholipid/cholesterol/gamma-HCH transport system permease protein [Tranquillimonas alkanivorans]|uniref:Phospholipid/cholesterol/gamma-HCH transport system permease protein n=1 Tax=Tranquillimonas alkanivorans TaxID=441119 RepID=A0A1I5Q554_9RHOB|nr:phospholipid/cholesterol/gamma-HCH transport system permease protein [Tranquillimonas alkanivorans]